MKKAYLRCLKKEDEEFADEYVVIIPLTDGTVESGSVNKEHFNERGHLQVKIIEDYGDRAIVLLPRKINKRDSVTVSTNLLY